MSPLHRSPVDKSHSAADFRRHVSHTKAANLMGPMRGGWRM